MLNALFFIQFSCYPPFRYDPCEGAGTPAQYFPAGSISIARGVLQLTPVADDSYSSCWSSGVNEAPENIASGFMLNLDDDGSQEVGLLHHQTLFAVKLNKIIRRCAGQYSLCCHLFH